MSPFQSILNLSRHVLLVLLFIACNCHFEEFYGEDGWEFLYIRDNITTLKLLSETIPPRSSSLLFVYSNGPIVNPTRSPIIAAKPKTNLAKRNPANKNYASSKFDINNMDELLFNQTITQQNNVTKQINSNIIKLYTVEPFSMKNLLDMEKYIIFMQYGLIIVSSLPRYSVRHLSNVKSVYKEINIVFDYASGFLNAILAFNMNRNELVARMIAVVQSMSIFLEDRIFDLIYEKMLKYHNQTMYSLLKLQYKLTSKTGDMDKKIKIYEINNKTTELALDFLMYSLQVLFNEICKDISMYENFEKSCSNGLIKEVYVSVYDRLPLLVNHAKYLYADASNNISQNEFNEIKSLCLEICGSLNAFFQIKARVDAVNILYQWNKNQSELEPQTIQKSVAVSWWNRGVADDCILEQDSKVLAQLQFKITKMYKVTATIRKDHINTKFKFEESLLINQKVQSKLKTTKARRKKRRK